MSTASDTRVYTVIGMTCDHCVASVREEVGELENVEAVEVHLESGRLEVRGDDISDADVADAVAEAGYTLTRG